jgi:chemotaxis signal transduction protein
MTASVVMVDFFVGTKQSRLCKAKQWHAGLVNIREIITNIINLGRFKQTYRKID